MKKCIAVSIALTLGLSVAPVTAASHASISDKELATFRALSKLPSGERAVSTSLTDDQLASVEGESSWSNVVIEQMTKGGGTNIAIVQQKNGESTVVEKQIGGNSTTEAVRVPKLSRVLLLGPLTSHVRAVVGAAVDIAGTQLRLCTFACSACPGCCEDCGAVVDISGALCWTADFVSSTGRWSSWEARRPLAL